MTMIVAVAVCVEGYLFTHVANVSRWASLLVAGLLVYPNDRESLHWLVLGLARVCEELFRQSATNGELTNAAQSYQF